MKRGIVIGKFYPPHRGHKYLIDTANGQVEQLTAIICERLDQIISGKQRKEWLEEIHPDIEVVVVDDIMKDDDSKAWAEYTKKFLGFIPDVVFTSEEYGQAYSKFLGSEHVLVDKERNNVPISATKIRDNPLENWEYIEPCVRAYYAKRICILGAESSGTTTIAEALAKHYNTFWVPEYGREYTEKKIRSDGAVEWCTEDFITIANEQNRTEDALARQCNKLLFCDTDSFATSIWHERYMGFISSEVDKISLGRNYDLYFLTDVDIPFVQDGFRDGEHIRYDMHKRFEEELRKRNKEYILLSGYHEQRMSKALQACSKIL